MLDVDYEVDDNAPRSARQVFYRAALSRPCYTGNRLKFMSLTRLAQESLDRYGEYVALAFEGRRYTNLEQDRAACRLAHALRRLGVAPGDRVMVMLPNCPEVTQSYAAILKCGGVIVPVIFLLGDREVAHILADSEAKVAITSADMLWKVESRIGVLPSLHHVLLVDGGGDDGKTRSLATEAAHEPELPAQSQARRHRRNGGRRHQQRGWSIGSFMDGSFVPHSACNGHRRHEPDGRRQACGADRQG